MKIHVVAIWVIAPGSDVIGCQRFGGLCCLHLQGEMNEDGGG